MNKKPSSDLYTVDVEAYAAWLTDNGYIQHPMPRVGQVYQWVMSYRRSDGPLKPYDWLCRIRDPDNADFEIELPLAFLVRVVAG